MLRVCTSNSVLVIIVLTLTRFCISGFICHMISRILQLCTDYANKRIAFGKLLLKHPLHLQTLSGMEVSYIFVLVITSSLFVLSLTLSLLLRSKVEGAH